MTTAGSDLPYRTGRDQVTLSLMIRVPRWPRLFVAALSAGAALSVAQAAIVVFGQAANPVIVSIWYSGRPPGTPIQDDLAALRALGFTHATWPQQYAAGTAELRRLAALVALSVDIRSPAAKLSATLDVTPGMTVDVPVDVVPASQLPALLWRALARGARTIAFDAGTESDAGPIDARGEAAPWVQPARAFARQVGANAPLFAQLDRGRAITSDPVRRGVDIHLLAAPRAWVLIATNTSSARIETVARMPAGVPYAPWSSLLDSEQMGMRVDRGGALWRLVLDGGSARVYLAARDGSMVRRSDGSTVQVREGTLEPWNPRTLEPSNLRTDSLSTVWP
jgi:hypothetical protein